MLNQVCKALAGAGISCSTSDVEGGVQTRFMEHVANYGISYGTTEEYNFRMSLFAKRDAAYNEINADPENTFTVGHNMFSTLPEACFVCWLRSGCALRLHVVRVCCLLRRVGPLLPEGAYALRLRGLMWIHLLLRLCIE